MPCIDVSGVRTAIGGSQMGIKCRRATTGPSGNDRRATGKCHGAGRGRQLPARAKPVANGLGPIPALDSSGEFRHMPAVAMQTAPAGVRMCGR